MYQAHADDVGVHQRPGSPSRSASGHSSGCSHSTACTRFIDMVIISRGWSPLLSSLTYSCTPPGCVQLSCMVFGLVALLGSPPHCRVVSCVHSYIRCGLRSEWVIQSPRESLRLLSPELTQTIAKSRPFPQRDGFAALWSGQERSRTRPEVAGRARSGRGSKIWVQYDLVLLSHPEPRG